MGNFAQLASDILTKENLAEVVVKKLSSGSILRFFRNGENGFKQVLTKPNGRTITTNLTKDLSVTHIEDVSVRGAILTDIGGVGYDRVTSVHPKIGGVFTFLGHNNQPGRGILYSNMSGRYGANNRYMPEFKQAKDYIRGRSTNYLHSYASINNSIGI